MAFNFQEVNRNVGAAVQAEDEPELTPQQQQLLDAFGGGDEGDTLEDEFGPPTFNWQSGVTDYAEDQLKVAGKAFGFDPGYLLSWLNDHQLDLIGWLGSYTANTGPQPHGTGDTRKTPEEFAQTPEGVRSLFWATEVWLEQQIPGIKAGLTLTGGGVPTSGSGGRRRGSGSRKPTAAEIRAQFDLDALAEGVQSMWRAALLEETGRSRAIAKAYVDQIVSNPDQKLDFEQFVLGRIRETGRYQTIYRRKPEALTEAQFLQPYVQAAGQFIGAGEGNQLANLAITGARLTASPDAFRQRLGKERQVTAGSGFLSKLGNRLSNMNGVLR